MIVPHRFQDRHLQLLDQRQLPHEEIWLTLSTPEAVAKAITDMVVRGAPAIGVSAAYGLALLGEQAANESIWQAACATMRAARPTAVNLGWAVDIMDKARDHAIQNQQPLTESLHKTAKTIDHDDCQNNQTMGQFGADWLIQRCPDRPLNILTHCNTGGLATAGWGTALGVIRSLNNMQKLNLVFPTETRPYWQGIRLTAWELVQDHIPHKVIPDSAVAHLVSQGQIDAAIVGSDRISADGHVANKIGTYAIAIIAAKFDIPFVVAAPTSTIDMQAQTGSDIPIEYREAAEVTTFRGQQVAPASTDALNPAFDVTTPDLVSAIVTERGVISPVTRTAIANQMHQ